VVKKGTETRDWTYVDDIINGLLAMGIKEEAVGEAINLGSGKEHRVIDLANMVNELASNEVEIRYVERRDWDVKKRLLSSIEKAKKLLDYKPQMEFEDGLKRVHEWFTESWENIYKSAEF
jgi:UDP-glucose 4-epimerase